MRTCLLAPIATAIVVLAPLAHAQRAICPEGKVETAITLPNGKVNFVCLPPAAAEGQANVPGDSPVSPASCPCFSYRDVETVVRTEGGVYVYEEPSFFDPSGGQCKYKAVRARSGLFAAMTKWDSPEVPCSVQGLFPIAEVNPNGCFRSDSTGRILRNPIPPAESLACAVILTEFHP